MGFRELQKDLVRKFIMLRKVEIKLSAKTLRAVAIELVKNSQKEEHSARTISEPQPEPIMDTITQI